MGTESNTKTATPEEIKTICHELLERVLEARVAFRADCKKLGKYDHDSPNLTILLDHDSALDAAQSAYVAAMIGGDVKAALNSHYNMTLPGTGTRGMPGAGQEISELITRIWY